MEAEREEAPPAFAEPPPRAFSNILRYRRREMEEKRRA